MPHLARTLHSERSLEEVRALLVHVAVVAPEHTVLTAMESMLVHPPPIPADDTLRTKNVTAARPQGARGSRSGVTRDDANAARRCLCRVSRSAYWREI
jgi:hypothetical protein